MILEAVPFVEISFLAELTAHLEIGAGRGCRYAYRLVLVGTDDKNASI